MSKVKISGPSSKVTPAVIGGDPHAVLLEWWNWSKGLDNTTAHADTSEGFVSLLVDSGGILGSHVALSLSQGFTVDGAPVFLKMDEATYTGDVPEGVGNRTDADDVVRTWEQWHDANHSHLDAANGDTIVPGNSWGVELTSGELLILLQAGYTFLMPHEVSAILPEPEHID